MGAEVDAQRVLSSCFAASSLRTQSAVLSRGTECIILASADLDSHIALTFSSGIRPNAGGVKTLALAVCKPVRHASGRLKTRQCALEQVVAYFN